MSARLCHRLAAAMIAAGLISRLAIAWQPFDFHAAKGALIDDSFYSLNIARHLAKGNGFTFDGENQTNGFQPLYVFLAAPLFRLFPDDRIKPVYGALTILAVCGAATGIFLFRVARRIWGDEAALFALVLYAFSPYAVESSQNGLETGIAGLFWMIALDIYLGRIKPGGSSLRDQIIQGASLALAVFTRIDAGILAVAIAADHLISREKSFPARLKQTAIISISALFLYLPWAAFNVIRFGALLPQSGEAVRYLAQSFGGWGMGIVVPPFEPGSAPLKFYLGNLLYSMSSLYRGHLFFPATPLAYYLNLLFGRGGGSAFSHLVIAASVLGGLIASRYLERGLDAIFIAIALMIGAYSFYAFGNWFFHRYYYPVSLCLLLLGSGMFARLWKRFPTNSRWIAAAVAAIAFAVIFYRTGKITFGVTTDDKILTYYNAAGELDKTVPAGARVGVFQAGTMGYFSERQVINLDGVVNHDALIALQQRKLLEYLRKQKIDYVADHAAILQMLMRRGLTPGEEKQFGVISPPNSKVIILRVRPDAPHLPR